MTSQPQGSAATAWTVHHAVLDDVLHGQHEQACARMEGMARVDLLALRTLCDRISDHLNRYLPDNEPLTSGPAEGSVLVRCADCGRDMQVWPDRAYPLVPEVVCNQGTGTHVFQWPERPEGYPT